MRIIIELIFFKIKFSIFSFDDFGGKEWLGFQVYSWGSMGFGVRFILNFTYLYKNRTLKNIRLDWGVKF